MSLNVANREGQIGSVLTVFSGILDGSGVVWGIGNSERGILIVNFLMGCSFSETCLLTNPSFMKNSSIPFPE